MKHRKTYGWSPSELDGTEHQFEEIPSMGLPKAYSYHNYMSPVLNQGTTNMCVTYSIAAHLNWNKNVDTDGENHRDNNVNINELYSIRSTPGDNGMTFKEALHYLRHSGVNSDLGKMKIEQYAMIKSQIALKQALLLNGPCIAGLMVYNGESRFWDKKQFKANYGGHAVSIVGYNETGFIIRNSWGPEWADHGYTVLPYEEFNSILECWTIVD